VCIGEFLDGYLNDRDDLKPNSQLVYGHTRRTLIAFFGREKPLKDITEYDAEQWQRFLMRQGLSKATVRKRTANAKVFFRVAVKQKLIVANTFQDLKSTSVGNDDRLYFLSRQDAQKVLDACPNTQWRLIFALCRFGGLRCPSEVLALRWQDVNWEQSRFLVHSCKTEHHEGKESRLVPIFPELRPYLLAAFEEAEPGSKYAVTRYRKANSNLRTQLERILKKAGLQPWPRLFQNLRSTRETELAESYPLHVVTAWIGNSKAIAAKHYLQIRDEDFERAARTPTGAAQNPAQSGAVKGCNRPQSTCEPEYVNCIFPVETAGCELAQVLAGQGNGDEGNRTLIPAMRPPCAPVTPRPQGS
jgi:integrase